LNTSNLNFSKLFWNDVINNTDLNELTSSAIGYWGRDGYAGRKNGDEIANYVKWYIQNNSCIPTLMETCDKSKNTFINSEDIITIAGSYLPVFQGSELSPDWRAFFNFKTSLKLQDYLLLLTNIFSDKTEKGNIKSENYERIQLTYEWFLNSCINFNATEIYIMKEWSSDSFLADKTGSVFKCSHLYYFIDGDNSIFQDEFPFIFLNASNRKHKALEFFLELLGVKILKQSEFKLNYTTKVESLKLQHKLKIILPYLIKWLEKTEQDDLLKKIPKLKYKVENLKIFTSDELKITYGDTWAKTIQVHFDSNILYVTTPWNSNKVMLNLTEQLCRYLDIKGYESELGFLLRVENTEEIRNYFSEEGIDTPELQETVFFNQVEDFSNQITLTPEYLASAGISTQEELEERLKDKTFASLFTHTSTNSFNGFQYVSMLIERAKVNIIAYLDTQVEYDCSNVHSVTNDSKSIIGGIKKNGEEIYIIARPSDNNEIIIYYSEEFDTLEYEEAELWYENGTSEPEKLTLGKILKVTGFNRIPV
jgi:hypothetical protein